MWERDPQRFWRITIPVVAVLAVVVANVEWPLAIALGVAAGAAVFLVPALLGFRAMGSGAANVPVDLTVDPARAPSSQEYERMSLAERNGVIAKLMAHATELDVEKVVAALPELLGKHRVSNLASQRRAQRIMDRVEADRIDREAYRVVLDGEIDLAARASAPQTPHQHAMAEANIGRPVDLPFLRFGVETTRLVLLNRTVGELAADALDGRADLAFVVGAVRKIGEKQSAEWAKEARAEVGL